MVFGRRPAEASLGGTTGARWPAFRDPVDSVAAEGVDRAQRGVETSSGRASHRRAAMARSVLARGDARRCIPRGARPRAPGRRASGPSSVTTSSLARYGTGFSYSARAHEIVFEHLESEPPHAALRACSMSARMSTRRPRNGDRSDHPMPPTQPASPRHAEHGQSDRLAIRQATRDRSGHRSSASSMNASA